MTTGARKYPKPVNVVAALMIIGYIGYMFGFYSYAASMKQLLQSLGTKRIKRYYI
jgi:hypothetical protein